MARAGISRLTGEGTFAVGRAPAPGLEAKDQVHRKRLLLAGFCRWRGDQLLGKVGAGAVTESIAADQSPEQGIPPLAPRLRQVLELLLAGEGEKQVAGKLRLSQHTVHDYVKAVYRRFGVSSRAELLALWVQRGKGNGM